MSHGKYLAAEVWHPTHYSFCHSKNCINFFIFKLSVISKASVAAYYFPVIISRQLRLIFMIQETKIWELIFLPYHPIWSVIFKSSPSKLVFPRTPNLRRRLIIWFAQRTSCSRSDSVTSLVFTSLSLPGVFHHVELLLRALCHLCLWCWWYSRICSWCLLLVSSSLCSFVFVISSSFNSIHGPSF